MAYDTLVRNVQRDCLHFLSELNRSHDPYRLAQLLTTHCDAMRRHWREANGMVQELEALHPTDKIIHIHAAPTGLEG